MSSMPFHFMQPASVMSQKFIDIVSKVFRPLPIGIEMTGSTPLPLPLSRQERGKSKHSQQVPSTLAGEGQGGGDLRHRCYST
jgi:hypothetical protein